MASLAKDPPDENAMVEVKLSPADSLRVIGMLEGAMKIALEMREFGVEADTRFIRDSILQAYNRHAGN